MTQRSFAGFHYPRGTTSMSQELKKDWAENARWKGIKRGYKPEDVARLRGSVRIE